MSRLTRGASAGETGIISSYSRAARLERLRRRWLLPWRVRTSLPEPVYSKRRAAALWVFNFGMQTALKDSTSPLEPQHAHALGGQRRQLHDQPRVAEPERARVGHLGVPVLAHPQRDRHLGHPEPSPVRLDRTFELHAEAGLFEHDRPKDVGA